MSGNPYGHGLFADLYNVNNPARAAGLVEGRVAPSFVDHTPAFGAPPNKAGFAATVSMINAAFRQAYRVERVVSQDAVHVGIRSAEVEHVGPFLGVPPARACLTVRGITAYELRDGWIVGHWEQFDVPAILGALGLFPPAGQARR